MLKIGDFSRLSQVSVKTLRYYDDMGLQRPMNVDAFTGYRYYSASQLPRLNRGLALKDLGFTLEQIAQVLEEGLTPVHLQGMLRLACAAVETLRWGVSRWGVAQPKADAAPPLLYSYCYWRNGVLDPTAFALPAA